MSVANLNTAIANIDQAIADLSANPRPNISYGGRSYAWAELLSMLIDKKRALLMDVQDQSVVEGGAFEVTTYGR